MWLIIPDVGDASSPECDSLVSLFFFVRTSLFMFYSFVEFDSSIWNSIPYVNLFLSYMM